MPWRCTSQAKATTSPCTTTPPPKRPDRRWRRDIRAKGVTARSFPCDFTDLAATEKLIGEVRDAFPDLSVLINSASVFIQENIEATSTETLTNSMNINLLTPYLLMREYKRQVNKGLIVNILDERIERAVPTFAAYAVTKAGLSHLTHLAALEFGETVRVNAIAPGLILPPVGETDAYLKKWAKVIPTRTHGGETNIVQGLEYLLENDFVNGETLFIDGGQSKT